MSYYTSTTREEGRLGGAMEVGYLPDMFGHVAQMPQLLRRFGIGHAVVWRGVPNAVDRTAFRWVAPDGSEVRATYPATGEVVFATARAVGSRMVGAGDREVLEAMMAGDGGQPGPPPWPAASA